MEASNYFVGESLAARYRHARPHFHAQALERIRQLSQRPRFARALDVGCGTGESTVGLAAIADDVTGIDASPEMLAGATAHARVRYQPGRAEQLDFANASFDLVTVALALHWFDPARFFAECRRVLVPAGLLAVYNDHFTAHMDGHPECKRWMRGAFARRFPQPRRGLRDMDEPRALDAGFRLLARESFEHRESYTRATFIDYLLTRSHTLAPILDTRQSEAEVRQWLDAELTVLLPADAAGEFIFKCNLWLLQRE